MKSNPPSILIFAAVTCPRLLNPTTCMEEGARFDPCRKGIIQVRRVRGEDVYKRKMYCCKDKVELGVLEKNLGLLSFKSRNILCENKVKSKYCRVLYRWCFIPINIYY
jgi:hypothetical protein